MNLVSLLVVFIVIWSIVFFITLPIGIKQDKNHKAGNDKGAPANPNIKNKIFITTLISVILSIIYYLLVENRIIIIGH